MEVQPAPSADAAVATAQTQTSAAASTTSVQGAVPEQQQPSGDAGSGIAPAIAKLFGSSAPQPVQLNVSYRVEGSDVVTVFTDPKTGKEVAQFPPELLLGLAKFFDQQSGVTFDKNA